MEDTRVFTSGDEAKVYLDANQYKGFAPGELASMSFELLFEMAKIEKEGVSYSYVERIESKVSFRGQELLDYTERPPREVTLYEGNPARYAEVCNMISSKLLYYSTEEEIQNFKSSYEDKVSNDTNGDIGRDVYKILEDHYQKNIEYLAGLDDYSKIQKDTKIQEDIQRCVGPLKKALLSWVPKVVLEKLEAEGYEAPIGKVTVIGSKALNSLRKFNNALLTPENGNDSIATQLKSIATQTGDPFVLKMLKAIFLTLKQAITGEASYGIIENFNNPAERLVKNAEKMVPPGHYQSTQHTATRSAGVESGLEVKTSQEAENSTSPTSTVAKGPGQFS